MNRGVVIKKLDAIYGAKYRKKFCEVCGSTTGLSNHHFIHRVIIDMRWRPENLITLCIVCHDKVHRGSDGRMWIEGWMIKNRAYDFQFLRNNKPVQIKTCDLIIKLKESK